MGKLLRSLFALVASGKLDAGTAETLASTLAPETEPNIAGPAIVAPAASSAVSNGIPEAPAAPRQQRKGTRKVRYRIVDRFSEPGLPLGNDRHVFVTLYRGDANGMTTRDVIAASGLKPKAVESSLYALRVRGLIRSEVIEPEPLPQIIPTQQQIERRPPMMARPIVPVLPEVLPQAEPEPVRKTGPRRVRPTIAQRREEYDTLGRKIGRRARRRARKA